MSPITTTALAATIVVVYFFSFARVQAGIETYGHNAAPTVFSAGFVGNYAGKLTAAKAISDLHKSESHHSLGDHLNEHDFPADYTKDNDAGTVEFAEAEAAATELHSKFGSEHFEYPFHFEHDAFEATNEIALDEIEDDFDSAPVVGIDHGKGAFSYSTLYGDEHTHEQNKAL